MKRPTRIAFFCTTLSLGIASAASPVFTPTQLLDLPAHYQQYTPAYFDGPSNSDTFPLNFMNWTNGNDDPVVIVHVQDGQPTVWEMILDANLYPISVLAPTKTLLVKVNQPNEHSVEVDLITSGPFAGQYLHQSDLGNGYVQNTYVTKAFALASLAALDSDDDHAVYSEFSPLYNVEIGAFLQKHDEFCKLAYVQCTTSK
ncbi:hypothetical protein MF271_16725 [Deinococcus sp. KNUC1210]|uniref:hypothetical protein n=1 Tax=Deinococcus sp. KNUC1210 TaxID=2917691 RepID=UPI001EF04C27|nr:hypothetical protein [Deinococcus sp. KNUC1210]ULH15532.1 hypothetical protein MF271_16725 [Deinococcus sp. KNUC1210]